MKLTQGKKTAELTADGVRLEYDGDTTASFKWGEEQGGGSGTDEQARQMAQQALDTANAANVAATTAQNTASAALSSAETAVPKGRYEDLGDAGTGIKTEDSTLKAGKFYAEYEGDPEGVSIELSNIIDETGQLAYPNARKAVYDRAVTTAEYVNEPFQQGVDIVRTGYERDVHYDEEGGGIGGAYIFLHAASHYGQPTPDKAFRSSQVEIGLEPGDDYAKIRLASQLWKTSDPDQMARDREIVIDISEQTIEIRRGEESRYIDLWELAGERP